MLSLLFSFGASLLFIATGIWLGRRRQRSIGSLRRRFAQAVDDCESQFLSLDELEPEAQVAVFAPALPEIRPSSLLGRLVGIRDEVRQVEDSLLQLETPWRYGRYDQVDIGLDEVWAKLDGIRGATTVVKGQLVEMSKRLAFDEVLPAITSRFQSVREQLRNAQQPEQPQGVLEGSWTDTTVARIEQHLEFAQKAKPNSLIDRRANAKEAALTIVRLETQQAILPQLNEIDARVRKEVPRLLARCGGPPPDYSTGEFKTLPWEDRKILQAATDSHAAFLALGEGNVGTADKYSRRARGRLKALLRWQELRLAEKSERHPSSIWDFWSNTSYGANVNPRLALCLAIIGLASSALAGGALGRTLGGPTLEVIHTGENLAQRALTRATHTLDMAHVSHNTVDGDLASAWVSGASLAEPQALIVDIRRVQAIERVLVMPRAAPTGLCSWDIEVSGDSGTWQKAGTGVATCGAEKSSWGLTLFKSGTLARYIRVRPLDWGKSGVAIAEIRVFSPNVHQ